MSNESENKRIDLEQFERMIGGTWSIEWLHGDPENEEPLAAINAEDYGTIAQTFYRDWCKPSDATTKAIGATPELIAELKRCYEIIDGFDETAERLEVAEDVLGRSGFWDDVYYQELKERLYE